MHFFEVMNKILFLILLCSCYSLETTDLLQVKRITDGDTIVVDDGSEKGKRIRLIGINAPESRNFKHRKKEAFGLEASAFLSDMLKGKRVRLEYDIESQDQYGRDLAYVFTEDGIFVNDSMLRAGYAEMMTFPPNVKYVDQFIQSQYQARKNKRGIWVDFE